MARILLFPSNIQVGQTFSSGLACGAIDFLMSEVNSYDVSSLAKYSAAPSLPGTYSSNSFTYTLIQDLYNNPYYSGIVGSFGTSITWVPGWGRLVPGL